MLISLYAADHVLRLTGKEVPDIFPGDIQYLPAALPGQPAYMGGIRLRGVLTRP